MVETILSSPLFIEVILPFLLVFTVVFAILQKTRILGEGKKQIDALVSLAIGLIVVSFGYASGLIISLIPVLAISVVVLLVFMLIYGMTHTGKDELKLPKRVKGVIGVLAAIVVVIAVLVATGSWDFLVDWIYQSETGSSTEVVANILFVVIILVAVGAVLFGDKDGNKGDKKDKE